MTDIDRLVEHGEQQRGRACWVAVCGGPHPDFSRANVEQGRKSGLPLTGQQAAASDEAHGRQMRFKSNQQRASRLRGEGVEHSEPALFALPFHG